VRSLLDERRRDAGDRFDLLRIVGLQEFDVRVTRIDARVEEGAIDETVAHDDVRETVVERNVRPRPQLEEDIRHRRELDATRVGDDELRAAQARLLHARADDWVPLGRVRAGEEDARRHVEVGERVRTAGLAERRDET